ncbi:Na+/H+ antiporter [Massilia sp. YIM B02443]|uniref:Na+/H+ antiporter n=1 Tax=Massilia sp. YIM B02443 TaxID=3050127 RepID=UPI0025B686CA|nr:Na+/H+ antiporter [Massilia sp. YIM B02443]MDN4040228.1 Na+/H+ antiporter [Massilia sp. YIM B02443]
MGEVGIVLAMLLAVVASGYLVRILPFAVPLPLVQIALGAIISSTTGHGVRLEPHIFFLLFLPPLLFLDGWRIPKVGLFRDRTTILELSLGLVLFTVIGAGFLIHWLIPSLPLAVSFALAAILAPTDPVAVSAIAARVPIPPRLMHILEGESLLNDASGLVCFRFAVAAALTGTFSLGDATLTFLWVALAGIAIGAGLTVIVSGAQRILAARIGEETGSPILVNLLLPFGAYLAAEHVEASGILAAVAAGITMSYVELSGRALATTRVRRAAVWDTVQFALNGVMFVLLGEQLPDIVRAAINAPEVPAAHDVWWLAGNALAISLGLVLLRFVWVWVSLRLTLLNARRQGLAVYKPNPRLILATSLAGVRGAITLAGVLTLPLLLPNGNPFPGRDLVIFLASAVIVVSLVLASVGLPRVLRGLELPAEAHHESEEDNARHVAAMAALEAIAKAPPPPAAMGADAGADPLEAAELQASALDQVRSLYQYRLDSGVAGGIGLGVAPARVRAAEAAERHYRLAALEHERAVLLRMARHNQLSDEIARKLLREIDLVEARYR